MALLEDLEQEVNAIFSAAWTERNGTVVPDDKSLTLGNVGINLDATILYADMSDSTELVDYQSHWFAAEVYKTYLRCASKIIEQEGGTIVSFDGDRVMAIYIGKSKNTAAARTALRINFAVEKIIQPALDAQYGLENRYVLNHTVGIDTSNIFVAKTGVRGSNDLVWVGKAANHAAKLCAENHDYQTWITGEVYDQLHVTSKFAGDVDMWTEFQWAKMNNRRVYGSAWFWGF